MWERLRKDEAGGAHMNVGTEEVLGVARRVEDLALGAARGEVGGAEWDATRRKLEDLRAIVQSNDEEVAGRVARLCAMTDVPVNLIRLLYVDAPELKRPGTPAPGQGEVGGDGDEDAPGDAPRARGSGLDRSSTIPGRPPGPAAAAAAAHQPGGSTRETATKPTVTRDRSALTGREW